MKQSGEPDHCTGRAELRAFPSSFFPLLTAAIASADCVHPTNNISPFFSTTSSVRAPNAKVEDMFFLHFIVPPFKYYN
jgi:hypothetical protein